MNNENYDCFISYNWNAKKQVEQLEYNLKEIGFKVWRDDNDLMSNQISGQIQKAINNSTFVICCITLKYCESYYCNLEFQYAIIAQKKMIILMLDNINPIEMTNIKIKNRPPDDICGIGIHISSIFRLNCYENKSNWPHFYLSKIIDNITNSSNEPNKSIMTLKKSLNLYHNSSILSLIQLKDKKTLACGCKDGKIKIWHIETGNLIKNLNGQQHTSDVNCLAILNKTNTLVSGSEDGTIKFWNTIDDILMKNIMAHNHGVKCLIVLPEDDQLISAGARTIKIWDLLTDNIVKILDNESLRSSLQNIVSFNDHTYLASCDKTKHIKIWNKETGKFVRYLKNDHLLQMFDFIKCLVLVANNKLASSSMICPKIIIWNLENDSIDKKLIGHTKPANCLVAVSNRNYLISGSKDKQIRIWDIDSGNVVKILAGHNDEINCLAILDDDSDDYKLASGSDDGAIKIWKSF